MVQLITATWKQIGVKLLYKVTVRETFRERVVAGEAALSVYLGEGGRGFFWSATPDRKVPVVSGSGCLWGTAYGQWFGTKGKEGMEPPPEVKKVQDLAVAWTVEPDTAKRAAIFSDIRKVFAEERFDIGTVAALPVPVVLKNGFHNAPQEGFHSFADGGYQGRIQPSQCWKEELPAA